MNNLNCIRIYEFSGIVQGVGFRPAICRYARDVGLGGWIKNCSGLVQAAFIGPPEHIDAFIEALPDRLPTLARIDSLSLVEESTNNLPLEFSQFDIIESEEGASLKVVFPPDLKICHDCRSEIFDENDRHYGYPFTTCTNCGPRYSVIETLPYDRSSTTMREFPLCEQCSAEYQDLEDRRFHAESIACPKCGPQLRYLDKAGKQLEGNSLQLARRALAEGKIVALLGIGGCQLAVDAFSSESINRLRDFKHRPAKPFAIMARNLDVARTICEIDSEAELFLNAPSAPILILQAHESKGSSLLGDLSPDTNSIGIMLPTSALHELIFNPLAGDPTPAFDALVMTSGNRRSEPIATTSEDALMSLSGIADFYLMHNREIRHRVDDSVGVIRQGNFQLWRRGRGFVPNPLRLQHPLKRPVLALGAHFKNTIALGYGHEINGSAHIGNLETVEAVSALEALAKSLPDFLQVQPEAVAVDLHPDFPSTHLGQKIAEESGIEICRIQHHYAHAASCMAEHGEAECLALAFDGTGLGLDGNIWGAELLHARLDGFRRLGTFKAVALPGGDAAVLEPKRQLLARLLDAGLDISPLVREKLGIDEKTGKVWETQIKNQVNAPYSHAAGRLFDAFAEALGVAPQNVSYEGQAAIRLETFAKNARSISDSQEIPFATREQDSMLVVDWAPAFELLASKPTGFREIELTALSMHHAIAQAAIEMLEFGAAACSCRKVALTGGVFMNELLSELVSTKARALGFEVLLHHHVPPNDGGISVGQALIAGYAN